MRRMMDFVYRAATHTAEELRLQATLDDWLADQLGARLEAAAPHCLKLYKAWCKRKGLEVFDDVEAKTCDDSKSRIICERDDRGRHCLLAGYVLLEDGSVYGYMKDKWLRNHRATRLRRSWKR